MRVHLARTYLTALGLALTSTAVSFAGPPPSGTIACNVASPPSFTQPKGLRFRPYINAVPRNVTLKAQNIASVSCDTSQVTAAVPLTAASFTLVAKLPNGDCESFTSGPALEHAKIKIAWRGPNGASGRLRTVSVSKAEIATADYDGGTHSLHLTTTTLTGAFNGRVATLHLGFDDYDDGFETACAGGTSFLGLGFGNTDPATLVVE